MLSVIIPVYKVENTLDRCVKSVISQDVEDMEVILVDDGSPDSCPEMCDEWVRRDERIRVIHKENGGLSDARNAGIEESKGDVITFVDSDDEVGPETYRPLLDYMQTNTECDILEYPIRFVGARKKSDVVLSGATHDVSSLQAKRDYWLREQAYIHSFSCNKLFRRHLFVGVKYPVGKVFEDVRTLPYLLLKAKSVASSQSGCYHYISNDSSISHQYENLGQLLEAQLNALDMLGINVGDSSGLYSELLNTQIDVYCFPATPGSIILPFHRFPLKSIQNWKGKIKLLVQNVFGLKFLCKVYRFAYNIRRIAR